MTNNINDPYLEKLLHIQNELKESDARLRALENDEVLPFQDIIELHAGLKKENALAEDFLTETELHLIYKNIEDSFKKDIECDKFDYAIAASSGILCGIIDILFVKTPHNGSFGHKTDALFEEVVIKLANKVKKEEAKAKKIEFKKVANIKSAIGILEKYFPVPYDQKATQEINKQLNDGFEETVNHLSANNHHVKSLSHYPDIFGLIASICNQWTYTSTFLDSENAKIQIVNSSKNSFELMGHDLSSKIYCGFINWFFHLASDMAGSSGAKGIGQGIPLPFTEFFQFCNFGKFTNEKGQWQTLATVMTKVYEDGYDMRHGVATSIPVKINDLITKSIFVLKEHFYNKKEFKDILISDDFNSKLQRITTISVATMCSVDLIEAMALSCGNAVGFFSHLNISAWASLGIQCTKELVSIANREMNNIGNVAHDLENEWEKLLEESENIKIQMKNEEK